MFVYTHFTGGGDDHAGAHLAARFSDDEGLIWTDKDIVVVPNEGDWNVMSVSLLRLADGQIALFYLQKNSLSDCRPRMRLSKDEGKTWSSATECFTDEVGYFVVNNDRVVQLKSGRLVIPTSRHAQTDGKWQPGVAMCYVSDDNGKTWQRSKTVLEKSADGKRIDFQEPGVVELNDGRLMMFIRTNEGCQYVSYSADGGERWTLPGRSTMASPLSPATIERIPSTGDLLLAWNDHSQIDEDLRGKRTPFCVAISKDEGKTWSNVKRLEGDPDGWYCYTAMDFVADRVLLGHCAGDRAKGTGLAVTQITSFDVDWLYRPEMRSMRYTSRSSEEAVAWQKELRAELFKILKLDDLVRKGGVIPFEPVILSTEEKDNYSRMELEINSTPGRRFRLVLTVPTTGDGPFPAVIGIHGHGHDRYAVYDSSMIYKGFATVLAESGYVTITTDVGQHDVYEEGRILMGERLWDVMRCADYLESLPKVDSSRMGCGGLSLGGEMAMWLGAMDPRMKATISAGFLTVMDQMEQNHCMCWKFDGLRELVGYTDIYSLTAPRALQCQNGLKEGYNDFFVPIAREAIKELQTIYADFGCQENAVLDVHEGGHEIDLPALVAFFGKHL